MTKTTRMSCSAAPALAAEDYLNELPYRIIKNVDDVCPVCGNSTSEREVIYKLKLDIFP